MAAGRGKDYYATLGVGRKAPPANIRKAYRHLARKLHPDVNPGDPGAEDRFKDIQEAYAVLSDKKKRAFYDRFGFYSDQAFAEGSGRRHPGGRPGGFGFDGFDFSGFDTPGTSPGPDLGKLFESLFSGGRRRRPSRPEKQEGEDLEYELKIGFEEAIRGTKVRLRVSRQRPCSPCAGTGLANGAHPARCSACNGTGQSSQAAGNMRFSVPCPVCGGEGRVRTHCPSCTGDGRTTANDTVEVKIPAGTGENSRLRLKGKGNAGLRGGAAGDLYIVAHIAKHPFFERNGFDINIKVPVTPAEAILGGKVEVPTIDGTTLLRIPPATNSGKTFRLRKRGVKDPRSGMRGDQFVRISIVVPEIPDETTKELMRAYARRNPENPREAILRSL